MRAGALIASAKKCDNERTKQLYEQLAKRERDEATALRRTLEDKYRLRIYEEVLRAKEAESRTSELGQRDSGVHSGRAGPDPIGVIQVQVPRGLLQAGVTGASSGRPERDLGDS